MDALAQIAQIKVIPRKEIYEPQPAKFIEKNVALKKGGKKVVYLAKLDSTRSRKRFMKENATSFRRSTSVKKIPLCADL